MLELRRIHELQKETNNHKVEMQALWEKAREKERKPIFEVSKPLELSQPGKDVTLTLRAHLGEYLNDIEKQTDRKISRRQRELIQNYVATHDVVRLSEEDKKTHRASFNRARVALRREWEMQTGQEWPKYQNDIYVNGKVARRAGSFYDAHHVVENSYGGPHTWWNLHPAAFPNEHQDGVHHDDSIATQIFGPIKPEYHTKPTDQKDHYVNRYPRHLN